MADQCQLQGKAGQGVPGWTSQPQSDICSEGRCLAGHRPPLPLHHRALRGVYGSAPRAR